MSARFPGDSNVNRETAAGAALAALRPAGQFTVTSGPEAGRRFVVYREAVVGRAADADLCLGDGEVSRRHVRIFFDDVHMCVEDLGSANGTFVNGRAVAMVRLADGDELRLGSRLSLRFGAVDRQRAAERERQRLESLGRLATGLAHDFNNMLAAASASLEVLAELPGTTPLEDPHAGECVADARSALRRAAELASRILAFSQAGRERYQMVDVSAAMAELVKVLSRTLSRSIAVQAEIAPGLAVMGDEAELHQLVMNLCFNARDALPSGGALTLRATLERGPQPVVVIEVEDDGVGMNASTLAAAFQPFFTTKERGVGLGLASAAEIAAQHGGALRAETSTSGAGSTFTLRLPALTHEGRARARVATVQRDAEVREPALLRHRNVLVVDDEPVVRRALERLLSRAGAHVSTAGDGVEALTRLREQAEPVDAIVLDIEMPRMSGAAVLAELVRMGCDVPVVMVSGHHDPELHRRMRAGGASAVLCKPFSSGELVDALQQSLARTLPRVHTEALTPEDTTVQARLRGAGAFRPASKGARDEREKE